MQHLEEEKNLIQRIDRVEEKVDTIGNKVDQIIEQGQATHEHVEDISTDLKAQKDHFHFLREKIKSEIVVYKRIFLGGGVILAFLLFWIILKI